MKSCDFQPQKPLVFLDLAAPRDIDPSFDSDPDTILIHLDTLKEIAEKNQKERIRLVKESDQFIQEAKDETLHWLKISRMDGTIQSLQERCREISEDSYRYLSRKMDLNDREKRLLQKVLHASLQRLLREPIQELKHLDTREEQEAYQKMVHQLFRIEEKERSL